MAEALLPLVGVIFWSINLINIIVIIWAIRTLTKIQNKTGKK